MLDERFVLLGVLISLIGASSYLIDTLKGKTKPNKVTWALWAAAPLIAFTAEIGEGVGLQSLMTFIVGFNPLLIFLASFVNKKAQWKISRFDITCGSLSLIGLILWQVTSIGNLAILFSLLSDGLASIPTLVKSYQKPETENYKVFLAATINSAITLLTIKTWNFAHYSFPIYIFLQCSILFLLIKFKIGPRLQKNFA